MNNYFADGFQDGFAEWLEHEEASKKKRGPKPRLSSTPGPSPPPSPSFDVPLKLNYHSKPDPKFEWSLSEKMTLISFVGRHEFFYIMSHKDYSNTAMKLRKMVEVAEILKTK